jgi:hypothetical protein
VDTDTPAAACSGGPSVGIDMVPAASAPQSVDILGNLRASDIAGVGNEGSDFYDAGAYENQSGTDDFSSIGSTSIVRATATTIDVSVDVVGDLNGNNTFTIEYKVVGTTTWVTHVENISSGSTYNTTIGGLTEGVEYDVRVTVNDVDGVSEDNATIYRSVIADADLSGLSISSGSLSPTFDAATTSYSATVAYTVSSLDVTAVLSDAAAGLTIGGAGASSNVAKTVALAIGSNNIDVVVTADGSSVTKTYTIAVTRTAASTDADLSALTLSSGSLSPSFSSGTNTYTANVAYAASSITMTATANDSGYNALTVNAVSTTSGAASAAISLSVGANAIPVVVTAEDGSTTNTYTVTVTRAAAATNANLATLTLSDGTLDPVFDAGTLSYTASVNNATTSVTVGATKADSNATGLTIDGTSTTSKSVSLVEGNNTINVITPLMSW